MSDVGIVALQMAIAESVSRQANVNMGHALQIVEAVFERHLSDEPNTHSAHQILIESLATAQGVESFIRQVPREP